MKNPELRFKNDIDDWEEQPIVNILQYEQPQKYIVNDDNYINSGIPVLTANKGFILGYTNENRVHSGECIIFDDFTMDSKYVNFDFMVKSSAMKILTCRENDNLKLLFEIFQKMKFESFGHSRHYISVVQPTNIKLPKLEVQSQIATLLSDIDTKIETQEQKVEKLKIFKSAMLDKMFPKEGQKVPEVRFDGFSGDWEESKLGENIVYIADNRGKNPPYYCNDGIPVIDNFMIKNNLYPNLKITNRYIDENLYNNFIRKHNQYQDILITLVGNGIGNVTLFPNHKCVIIQNTLGVRYKGNQLFYFYLFNAINKKIKDLDRQLAQPNIRQDELWDIDIWIPPTLEEQEKIGKYFEVLDNKIELEISKLNKLKDIKNAMLNKLLP